MAHKTERNYACVRIMIETILKIQCDGGGGFGGLPRCNVTEISEEGDITKAEFRKHLSRYGWRCSKKGDFCPSCVRLGKEIMSPVGDRWKLEMRQQG